MDGFCQGSSNPLYTYKPYTQSLSDSIPATLEACSPEPVKYAVASPTVTTPFKGKQPCKVSQEAKRGSLGVLNQAYRTLELFGGFYMNYSNLAFFWLALRTLAFGASILTITSRVKV